METGSVAAHILPLSTVSGHTYIMGSGNYRPICIHGALLRHVALYSDGTVVNQCGTMEAVAMDGDIGIYECQLFVCLFIRMSSQRVPIYYRPTPHKEHLPAKKQIDSELYCIL